MFECFTRLFSVEKVLDPYGFVPTAGYKYSFIPTLSDLHNLNGGGVPRDHVNQLPILEIEDIDIVRVKPARANDIPTNISINAGELIIDLHFPKTTQFLYVEGVHTAVDAARDEGEGLVEFYRRHFGFVSMGRVPFAVQVV